MRFLHDVGAFLLSVYSILQSLRSRGGSYAYRCILRLVLVLCFLVVVVVVVVSLALVLVHVLIDAVVRVLGRVLVSVFPRPATRSWLGLSSQRRPW